MCKKNWERIKARILGFLDEPEIQHKIRTIAEQKPDNTPVLTRQLAELQRQHQKLQADHAALQQQLTAAQRELRHQTQLLEQSERQQEQLSDQLQAAQQQSAAAERQMQTAQKQYREEHDKFEEIHNSFQAFATAYASFQKLSATTRSSLSGIFIHDSLVNFILCGIQPDNILSLWDFCKTEFNQGKLSEHDLLVNIFRVFFEAANQQVSRTPRYQYQAIAVGEKFDTNTCSSTSDSAPVGNIAEILLPGICYASNQRLVKKALVQVK